MLLCTFHVGSSLVPSYAGPLGNPRTVTTMIPGLGSSYRRLAETPLAAWLDQVAPGWTPPLVMVGWSAGCFAIRDWLLSDPEAIDLIDVAVLLDGLHSPGADCDPNAIAGVVALAEDPDKLVVVTHTSIDPGSYASTSECAELMKRTDALVLSHPGDQAEDHVRQVRVVGPEIMSSEVEPWLRGAGGWRWLSFGIGLVAGLGGLYVAWRWW